MHDITTALKKEKERKKKKEKKKAEYGRKAIQKVQVIE